jgi:hypothetical protein
LLSLLFVYPYGTLSSLHGLFICLLLTFMKRSFSLHFLGGLLSLFASHPVSCSIG